MAYIAALISLKHNLVQLYHLRDGAKICWPEVLYKTPVDLYQMVCSIQTLVEEEDFPYLQENYLEKEIRQALWRAKDVVESYLSTHFLSSSSDAASQLSEDLVKVMQEIKSIKEKLENFVHELKLEELEVLRHQKNSPLDSSSYGAPSTGKNKMVGALDLELEVLKFYGLFNPGQGQVLGAALIHGMGGIGKTSLAISFYNDSDVRSHFSLRAWVKISLKHCVRDILLGLLLSVEEFGEKKVNDEKLRVIEEMVRDDDDERLENLVREEFAPKKYLVVVDCLCDVPKKSWDYLKGLLPDSNNGSRIILVNRMNFRPDEDEFKFFHRYQKTLLDEYNSWNLLREKVFGDQDEPCPSTLERIGKRIASNCKGLPLAIITVGLHLAKKPKTVEYWKKVAESGNSLAYVADGEAMYRQLGLSYRQLPPRLRPFLLYMGAFPESERVSLAQLQNLWVAEGFLEDEEYTSFKYWIGSWVNTFYWRKVVEANYTYMHGETFYYLHHAMWHFCCYEAEKEEFFHVVDKSHHVRDSPQLDNILNPRRLVIQNNILFGVRELAKFSENIHSLLFNSPYHPYPLRISLCSYKLLGVLNALSIRFFEFPVEILSLTLLRYLALTLNRGDLPAGISKLRNLEFLIVHLHHQIMRSFPLYLPEEIWEMQRLVHLECMGSDLPAVPPEYSDAMLPNLSTLWGVSPHSCSEEILKRIPNLSDLRISISLAPKDYEHASPLCPFDHLGVLQSLVWLQCAITNPYFEANNQPQVVTIHESISRSMDRLLSLTLSGCGFPWESIEHISQLPLLDDLILRCHAFRGSKWKLTNRGFKRLKRLVLEDLDLVYWTARPGDQFFPCLQTLVISHLHKLRQISPYFVNCSELACINIINSRPAVETWVWFLQMERSRTGGTLIITISNPKDAPIFT